MWNKVASGVCPSHYYSSVQQISCLLHTQEQEYLFKHKCNALCKKYYRGDKVSILTHTYPHKL